MLLDLQDKHFPAEKGQPFALIFSSYKSHMIFVKYFAQAYFLQIQVHTDANEAIGASPIPATDLDHSENHVSHGE